MKYPHAFPELAHKRIRHTFHYCIIVFSSKLIRPIFSAAFQALRMCLQTEGRSTKGVVGQDEKTREEKHQDHRRKRY